MPIATQFDEEWGISKEEKDALVNIILSLSPPPEEQKVKDEQIFDVEKRKTMDKNIKPKNG